MSTEEVTNADRRYASRKWRLVLLVWGTGTLAWILSTVFYPVGWLSAPVWVEFSKWMVGLYMAGNVGDTAAEKLYSVYATRTS